MKKSSQSHDAFLNCKLKPKKATERACAAVLALALVCSTVPAPVFADQVPPSVDNPADPQQKLAEKYAAIELNTKVAVKNAEHIARYEIQGQYDIQKKIQAALNAQLKDQEGSDVVTRVVLNGQHQQFELTFKDSSTIKIDLAKLVTSDPEMPIINFIGNVVGGYIIPKGEALTVVPEEKQKQDWVYTIFRGDKNIGLSANVEKSEVRFSPKQSAFTGEEDKIVRMESFTLTEDDDQGNPYLYVTGLPDQLKPNAAGIVEDQGSGNYKLKILGRESNNKSTSNPTRCVYKFTANFPEQGPHGYFKIPLEVKTAAGVDQRHQNVKGQFWLHVVPQKEKYSVVDNQIIEVDSFEDVNEEVIKKLLKFNAAKSDKWKLSDRKAPDRLDKGKTIAGTKGNERWGTLKDAQLKLDTKNLTGVPESGKEYKVPVTVIYSDDQYGANGENVTGGEQSRAVAIIKVKVKVQSENNEPEYAEAAVTYDKDTVSTPQNYRKNKENKYLKADGKETNNKEEAKANLPQSKDGQKKTKFTFGKGQPTASYGTAIKADQITVDSDTGAVTLPQAIAKTLQPGEVVTIPVEVTYPDGSSETVKATFKAPDLQKPEKTAVSDKTALTGDEQKQVKKAVKKVNPGLKDDQITVDETGKVTVIIGNESKEIPASETVEQIDHLTVPEKTLVQNKDKLTPEEIKKVEAAVRKANKKLTDQDKIAVDEKGNVTINIGGKEEKLTPDQTIQEDPVLKLNAPKKTPVKDLTNLDEKEKEAVEKAVKEANPNLGDKITIDVDKTGKVTVKRGNQKGELEPNQTVEKVALANVKYVDKISYSTNKPVAIPEKFRADADANKYPVIITGKNGETINLDALAYGNNGEKAPKFIGYKYSNPGMIGQPGKYGYDASKAGTIYAVYDKQDEIYTGDEKNAPEGYVKLTFKDAVGAKLDNTDENKVIYVNPKAGVKFSDDGSKLIGKNAAGEKQEVAVPAVVADTGYTVKYAKPSDNQTTTWPYDNYDKTSSEITGAVDFTAQVEVQKEKLPAPTVTPDDKGAVTVTPPAKADKATTIEITYTPEGDNAQPKTVTVTKDDQGKWKLPENETDLTIDPETGVVTIPADKVKDKSDVKAQTKGDEATTEPSDEATGKAGDNPIVKEKLDAPIVTPDDKGAVTVTPPAKADKAKTIDITYTPEGENAQPKTVTVTKDDQGKWKLPENETDLTIDPETGVVTIPADKVKDKSDVKAQTKGDEATTEPSDEATGKAGDNPIVKEKLDAPIVTPDDKGAVTVTPPAKADKAKTIDITYTPEGENAQPKTVTLTKDDQGKWKLPENETDLTIDPETGVVTIPADKVKDKSDVKAQTKGDEATTEPSDESTGKAGDNPVVAKPAAPTIDPIKAGDKVIKVKTPTDGDTVIILIPNPQDADHPTQIVAKKGDDGVWKVGDSPVEKAGVLELPLPETVDLQKDMQINGQVQDSAKGPKAVSDTIVVTVQEKDQEPEQNINVPDKTIVADPSHLTDKEKEEIANKVKEKNPNLPADSKIIVGDDGTVTIKDKDDQVIGTIPGDKVVGKKSSTSSGGGGGVVITPSKPDVKPDVKPNDKPGVKPGEGDLNNTDHYQYLIGYPDGTFGPNRGMTRAEVATMFTRLLKDRPVKGQSYASNFSDVHAGDWYANTVGYAVQKGIVSGYPDGTFQPNKPITRAEFAAIAARFAQLTAEDEVDFTDLSQGHWAYKAIRLAASKGWVSGYPNNTFAPEKAISRAEVTSITNRMLNRYADLYWIDAHMNKVIHFSDVARQDWFFEPVMEATMGHDFTRDADGKTEHWTDLNDKTFI
ncbi:S-layer homology domain-containing protein [Peptococcus simiae]|uniref:S-layer homology domain-containing protein n=1 Tax=Peptococcus simiae TaxID=1643805 RepID=A0ABW9GXB0_9FIRM